MYAVGHMSGKSKFSPAQLSEISERRKGGQSFRSIASHLGASHGAVSRAVATLARRRTAEEFEPAKAAGAQAPRRLRAPHVCWPLERIRAARDAQMRGDFELPVRLAEAMRTDDALFIAYHNRISPQNAIEGRLIPQESARGRRVQAKALGSIATPRTVLAGIAGTLANHGVAVGYVVWDPREDGTIVDMTLTEWPLESVQWNTSTEQLETTTRDEAGRVPIVHGDGHWIIFRKFGILPWTQEACVLPGAMVWASHANSIRDWNAGSASHGQAKIVGELPEGVAILADAAGGLTPEAGAFLDMLQDIVSGDSGAALRPANSKTEFLANGSTAWQVFSELAVSREKAAARIYLGTDAILGSVGGAPGVDIAALFGVASAKFQGDFQAIADGLDTGLAQVWTAVNEGDTQYSPHYEYEIPDPDAETKSEQNATRRARLADAIAAMRAQQMIVDQPVVDQLALEFGVSPPPQLAAAESRAVPIVFAPTQLSSFVLVREARTSQGLPPFGDVRDTWTIAKLDAVTQAEAAGLQAKSQAQADIAVDNAAPVAPAPPAA